MTKKRGFEPVSERHRAYFERVKVQGREIIVFPDVELPKRADKGSAGYDFFAPVNITILPKETAKVYTNVKAYMQEDEVLLLVPRSSLGINGLVVANTLGVIDSSYYNNPNNEGNIILTLYNRSGKAINIKRGERFVQGIFTKYLIADEDTTLHEERIGGTGSSGK